MKALPAENHLSLSERDLICPESNQFISRKNSEAVATVVPFIQKRWYLLLLLFHSVSSMVWQQLESFVKEWSGCVFEYFAFFSHFDFLCCSMNSNCVSWVCASLCMYLAAIFFLNQCVVKRIPPPAHPVNICLALNHHNGNMYDKTANCFFNHEEFLRAWLPSPTLSICFTKTKRKKQILLLAWSEMDLILKVPKPSNLWDS